MVNATDPVKRFASGARDSVSVLTSLLTDLGSARGGFLGAAVSALLVGVSAGFELASLRPVWLFADEERSRKADIGVGGMHHAALERSYEAPGTAGNDGAAATQRIMTTSATSSMRQVLPTRRQLQTARGDR